MADRLRAVMPFPAAGEGVSLKFSNAACNELQKRFGPEWFTSAVSRLNNFDVEYMKACVELGACKDGNRADVKFDNLDAPLMDVAQIVLDALYMSVHCLTFTEFMVEARKRMEALQGNQNPTSASSPENTSAT